jgi:hypothetical protein
MAAERCSRNLRFWRRLPTKYGGHILCASPYARLRYLRPVVTAFDRELLQLVRNFTFSGQIIIFDVGTNVSEFAVAACHFLDSHEAVLVIGPDPFLCAEPGNVGCTLRVRFAEAKVENICSLNK